MIAPILAALLHSLVFSPQTLPFPTGLRGAVVLVNHAKCASAAGNGCTTSAVDMRGANIIVIFRSYNTGTVPTLTSSTANTFTDLTAQIMVVTNASSRFAYVLNSATSSTQTFTCTCTACFPSMVVAGFSNVTSFDTENSTGSLLTTSPQSGSITPNAGGNLVMAGLGWTNNASTVSINGGYTITDTSDFNGGVSYATSMAYLVQATAAATNPTWTMGTLTNSAAFIADFKR